jgi:hypothetical protein
VQFSSDKNIAPDTRRQWKNNIYLEEKTFRTNFVALMLNNKKHTKKTKLFRTAEG